MLGGSIPVLLRRELRLLQLSVRRHPALLIVARQLEHRVIQRVETGQRHELEFVPHRA